MKRILRIFLGVLFLSRFLFAVHVHSPHTDLHSHHEVCRSCVHASFLLQPLVFQNQQVNLKKPQTFECIRSLNRVILPSLVPIQFQSRAPPSA